MPTQPSGLRGPGGPPQALTNELEAADLAVPHGACRCGTARRGAHLPRDSKQHQEKGEHDTGRHAGPRKGPSRPLPEQALLLHMPR